ncbi:MAG: hypothetical protein P4L79_06120 [Legionella sp.]|uniref:hypothetical protein n=1 Tax=Legionella sp. TaxID=459 RepID=UPI00283D226E|nr:hypothetical protein [Legionella sp.]
MFTKLRKPKDIHLYTCEEMGAYALTLRKDKIKHLDLSDSPFPSMSVEQMAALGKMIHDSKVTHLILKRNNFGHLSLSCLEAFATALSGAEKLVEFSIDGNRLQVPDFSFHHWQVLRSLFASLSLKTISLQYNELDGLEEEQFKQFKQLIREAKDQCLIGINNWSSERWIEIINAVEWRKQGVASSPTL